MGEGKKNVNDRKKKEEHFPARVTVVLKVDMHCDGCEARIVRLARGFQGVETVKSDTASSKLTVIGFVDPSKLRDDLQKKTKKKVDLISPEPKKENGDKKPDDHNPDNEKNPKQAVVSTAVLKLSFHCQGCTNRIHRIVRKTKGVYKVEMDEETELVTVTGAIDVKSLTENLKEKLRRPVEILPRKKEKEKEKENKTDGVTGCGGNKTKSPEGSKMESPGQPGFGFRYGYGYNYGPCGHQVRPEEVFSEENPNACSVM